MPKAQDKRKQKVKAPRTKTEATLTSIEKSLIVPPKNKRKRGDGPLPTPAANKLKRHATLYPSKEELVARILAFVKKHGAIRQGTPNWYKLMKTTIGGSELGALLNENKYKTRSQLLKEKGEASVSHNQEVAVACLWGKLFEAIIRMYIEAIYNTRVYGHDICIANGQFRYSPDGLGVVSRPRGGVFDIVLFEFKCPYLRVPDGRVPPQYELQIQAGLAATEEIEPAYGLYVDAVFRKCSIDQLNDTPDHDREYHSKGRPLYVKPVAWGKMNVYSRDPGEVIDYGAADKAVFDEMLRDVDRGVLVTSLVYLTFTDDRSDILNAQGRINGMYFTGCIPFKMMKVCSRRVDPVPDFGVRIMAEVNKFFEDLKKDQLL